MEPRKMPVALADKYFAFSVATCALRKSFPGKIESPMKDKAKPQRHPIAYEIA